MEKFSSSCAIDYLKVLKFQFWMKEKVRIVLMAPNMTSKGTRASIYLVMEIINNIEIIKLRPMTDKRFRIEQIENQKLQLKQKKAEELDPKLTKKLVTDKMYLYIDINTESGFKTMYECDSSDQDDQTQKIGKKYKVNLNDLQCPNSKAISFLHKMKQGSRKKRRALSMVRDQLKKSTQKIMNIKPELDPLTQTKYLFTRKTSINQPSEASTKSKIYKPKENKMLTLLNSSLLKELAEKKSNYSTVDYYTSRRSKPSAQERTEKYMKRIKLMLPSISNGRKSVCF